MPYQRKTPLDFPRLTPKEKEAMCQANRKFMKKRRKILDCTTSGIKLTSEVW